jgi:hypothetical protein
VGGGTALHHLDAPRAQPVQGATEGLASLLPERRRVDPLDRGGAPFEVGPREGQLTAGLGVVLEEPREQLRRPSRLERREHAGGIAVGGADRVGQSRQRGGRALERSGQAHERASSATQAR